MPIVVDDGSNNAAKFLSSNEKFFMSESVFSKSHVESKKNRFGDVITTSSDIITSKCLKNSRKMRSTSAKI